MARECSEEVLGFADKDCFVAGELLAAKLECDIRQKLVVVEQAVSGSQQVRVLRNE